MQITKAEVIPIQLKRRHPFRFAGLEQIQQVCAIFVRIETRQGQTAWGCAVAHPTLTGEKPETVLHACQTCADLVGDLNPINIEYALDMLAAHTQDSPAAMCAFDLAFHDLLGLSTGLPLYRILGGYRNRIQTSITIPIMPFDECLDLARRCAAQGFRILKIKGGIDPAGDVRCIQAIHNILPNHTLRLDADGGYSIEDALDVCRALDGMLEMLEQPVAKGNLAGLRQLKEISPVPVLADQSVSGPDSALELAAGKMVDGLSIKLTTCGGLRNARLIDAIARAAKMTTMISCFVEPALLTAAGLSLALSSPNVHYGDLDGYLDLANDPSYAGFRLEDGWLIAADVPGLGYTVNLG